MMKQIITLLLVIGWMELCMGRGIGQVTQKPKKHALLIGIDNYKNNKLVGCEKDARNMRDLLVNQSEFSLNNISMLLNNMATRQAIIDLIKAKQLQVRRGDLFVFYFSGHGARFPDEKSEEWDELKPGQLNDPNLQKEGPRFLMNLGLDSALCPVNVGEPSTSGKPWENLILDDELYLLFAPFVQKGCAVVLIVDSCHSGTVAMMKKIPKNSPPPLERFHKELSSDKALTKPLKDIPETLVIRTVNNHYSSGLYLALTASRDLELSGATANGSYYTNALIAVVKQNPRLTYQEVYQKVKSRVWDQTDREQDPQLDQRFFSGSLKGRFLALPQNLPQEFIPLPLRLRLQITDWQKRAVINPVISITSIRDPNLVGTGITRLGNHYVTGNALPQGAYRISVTHPAYKSVEATIDVEDANINSGLAEYWVRMTRNRIVFDPGRKSIEGIKIIPQVKRADTIKIIRTPQ